MSKLDNLVDWFADKNKVMIALSGGVDSAVVAYAAFQALGSSAIAVTADYKTLSQEELQSGCFHCRMELGEHLIKLSKTHDVKIIVDGTNLDDLGDYRPGIQALKENGIRSPLVETKFIKSEIREIAKSAGLTVHDRPANSCLASRIPWGQRVTAERLVRIELGETLVKQLTNLKQVRVRDIQGCAKIEVDKEKVSIFDEKIINQLNEKLKIIGFTSIEIDKEGYKPGKINVISN